MSMSRMTQTKPPRRALRGRAVTLGLVALLSTWVWNEGSRAQDPAAARLLDEARRLQAVDEAGALEAYDLLSRQFPDDALAPKAVLEIAELSRARRDATATERALDHLIERYGRSPEAAEAYRMKSEILFEVARNEAELEDARATARRVSLLFGPDRYPILPARERALALSGTIGALLGDPGAVADFSAVIENDPLGPHHAEARLGLGRSLLARGDWQAAIEALQGLLDLAETTDATSGVVPAEATLAPARALLSLIHRRYIRPQTGQPFFAQAKVFAPALGLEQASGVAAAANGEVVVTDGGQPLVALVDATGTVVARTATRGLERPFWGRDGRPAALADDGLVRPFGGSAIRLDDLDKDGPLKGLLAVASGRIGGHLAVAKSHSGLLRYAVGSWPPKTVIEAGKQDLVDLDRGPEGRTYVLDKRSGSVRRVDARDRVVTVVQGTWKRAWALAIDQLGYFFVLDRGEARIHVYDAAGNPVTTVGPAIGSITLRAPNDITVDGSGRLVIADAKLPHLVRVE